MARPRTMTITSWIQYTLTAALCLIAQRATAQDACACSASRYVFTLDFSLSCPPVNITTGNGVEATFCQVSPFGDADQQIDDLVPVTVEYVDVLELSQTFQVLSQQNISGTFGDGDSFSYTSIVDQADNDEVPKVLQLNIFAFNAEGQPIVNFYAISFSNSCTEFTPIEEGGSAGWTHFMALEPPSLDLCPGYPTESPTLEPSTSPDIDTPAPVVDPVTEAPVDPVTEAPVDPVTEAPVDPVTEAPVDPVTEAPVDPVTEAPVDPVTEAPVDPVTEAPVDPVTEAPVDPVTEAPVDPVTSAPTEPDVIDPTDSPTMFMSMDMSIDIEDALGAIDVMSMAMSMPATFRNFDLEMKSEKAYKSEKESKSYKDEKKSKYEKSDKSSKDDKKSKYEKSDKSSKSDKSGKYEKKEKRRRLRVHPVYEV